MDLPQYRNLTIWFRCQLCRGSFPSVTEFIEHKQEWHLTEFEKFNSNCIIFEEITAANQEYPDQIPARTTLNSLSQTKFQGAGPEPENEIVSPYDPPPPPHGLTDALCTAKGVSENLELFTYDNETERENDSRSRVTRSQSNGVSINEHHNDNDGPSYDLKSPLNQVVSERPQQLESSSDADISAAACCVSFLARNHIDADIEPSFEPLNGIQQPLDLNFRDQIYTCTTQTTEIEEIYDQTVPQVNNPYVMMRRLTLNEIQAASQISRPSKGKNLKPYRPPLKTKIRKAAAYNESKPKLYKCSKAGCSKIFRTLRSRTIHLATHAKSTTKTNDNPILVCELCSRTFRFKKSFKQHYFKMHNPDFGSFYRTSSRQGKGLERLDGVQSHSDGPNSDTNGAVSNTEVQITLRETLNCSKLQNTMNRVFYNRDLFKTGSPKVQIKRLTSDQVKAAIILKPKTSKKRRNTNTQKANCSFRLKKNSDSNTPQNSLLNSDLKPFKCTQPGCTKLFRTHDYLKRHSTLHKEGRPTFPCKICKVNFCSNFSLSRHSFLVHNQIEARPCKCSFIRCSNTFKTEAALKRHTAATHSTNKSVDRDRPVFTCDICKIVFFYKFSLKRHNLTSHRDDRADQPFKCTKKDCSASYNCESLLVLHKKRHYWK